MATRFPNEVKGGRARPRSSAWSVIAECHEFSSKADVLQTAWTDCSDEKSDARLCGAMKRTRIPRCGRRMDARTSPCLG